MEFGQPAYLKEQAEKSKQIGKVRLDEGENVHRILFGPVKVQSVYWPTLVEDPDTGTMIPRNKLIRRPAQGTVFDTLASLEKRVRAQMGESNPRSSLSPSNKWWYLVIDRNDPTASIQIAEYPYTVFKRLVELESQISTKNRDNLRHGLIFQYDVIITKKVDPTKPKFLGTSYEVDVDPENAYTGKVPAKLLGAKTEDLKAAGFDPQSCFSEEDWDMVESCDINLEEAAKPDTPESVIEKLKQFPLNLGATGPDGSFRFPSKEKFMDQLQTMGLNYLDGDKE